MTVILPALKSNNLIFDILSFVDCIRAYIIMRSLSRKAHSKVHLLSNFVAPHEFSENRFSLENLEKLASLQTLKFPIIINLSYSTDKFDQYSNVYPNSFFKMEIDSSE